MTGERVVLVTSAEETGGESVRGDYFAPPGFRVMTHIHPRQEERIAVVSGTVDLRLEGGERQVVAGQSIVVPPGARHAWRNSGDGMVHLAAEFRPPLRSVEMFESYFVLARMGRAIKRGPLRGYPRPLQFAVLLREYRDEAQPALPPFVQAALLGPFAAIGRLVGCQTYYSSTGSGSEAES